MDLTLTLFSDLPHTSLRPRPSSDPTLSFPGRTTTTRAPGCTPSSTTRTLSLSPRRLPSRQTQGEEAREFGRETWKQGGRDPGGR